MGFFGWTKSSLMVILLGLSLFMGGCFLTMPKPLLSSRHLPEVPNLVGRYLDDQGQEIRILSSDSTNNNTFVAYPPNKKNALYVTIQPLDGNRYIAQARPDGGQGVFLSVADINLPNITLYVFPASGDEIRELASRNQVTVNEEGLITEYSSAQGIIRLFMGLYGIENKDTITLTKQAR
jgi:hypothetical protein